MFIGREFELSTLDNLYNEDTFHFVVMYGRRRVGKTTLLTEFCKNKPSIFFVAEEYNDKIALESFSEKILTYFGLNEVISKFDSWEKAFLFLAKQAKDKRLVLVIDEFPYIVNSNKSIPSLLQNLIDHHLKDTKLFIIICGSSMSFIEKEVLSHKSPLYGRRTAQIIVEPFDFFDSIKFFPNYNFEEQVLTYGILDGIPHYLSNFKDTIPVLENVKRKILNKTSYLYEEPKMLLKQEVREPALYNSIIEAIANGSSKLNEISTKIGVESDKCSKYLSTLIDLRIIEKLSPIEINGRSRKSIYRIKDNFFKFWFKFVFDNKTLIEQDMLDIVIEEKIKPYLNEYLGPIYEEICLNYLRTLNKQKKLPFIFENIGKWWGNNPSKKKEEEIDIVALNKDNIIFGECKWKNEKVDINILNSLIEKTAMFNFEKKYYLLCSKSGFTDKVIQYAKDNKNLILIEGVNLLEF
ncbi:AAA family ATPase [Caloramator proteoclasticus]|uniref:DUF234 domain-containing protein n=1 Tax=Caloramator proteoclasticus DSM 10124 TaxID=1121262 RepID=A0A1M4XGQ8_9CLOT|nr:ATP-binding protein [Caloramator proteoclasticus]SHE92857.1 hypothetical protein SAMN02746091_01410 [Caloramator proteoclasticus DSM 10124]